MTPGNITGMALIKGLQAIALTDHNTARNCPAASKHAKEYGITFIPGMELTTQEEFHVVCLFPSEVLKAFKRVAHYVERPFPCGHIKIESHGSVLLSLILFLEQPFALCVALCPNLPPPYGDEVNCCQQNKYDHCEQCEVISDEVHTPALERVVIAAS